jgi:hypothetical protein
VLRTLVLASYLLGVDRAMVIAHTKCRMAAGSEDDVHAAVREALRLGAIGYDAVKHLVLCRIEHRPPKLDLAAYPYLPRVTVATTSAEAYMTLLGRAAAA